MRSREKVLRREGNRLTDGEVAGGVEGGGLYYDLGNGVDTLIYSA